MARGPAPLRRPDHSTESSKHIDRSINSLPMPAGGCKHRIAPPQRPPDLAASHALRRLGIVDLPLAQHLVARQEPRRAPCARPGDGPVQVAPFPGMPRAGRSARSGTFLSGEDEGDPGLSRSRRRCGPSEQDDTPGPGDRPQSLLPLSQPVNLVPSRPYFGSISMVAV
jgi:hypothetical protein